MPKSQESQPREADQFGVTAEWSIAAGQLADGRAPPGDELQRPWLFALPGALGAAYAAVAALVGPGVFDTGAAGLRGLAAVGLLSVLVLVSVWASARLYDDALALRETDADWQPRPWRYLFGGAAALTALRVVQLWTGAVSPARPVPYLAGTVVVALTLASVVAGPAYLLRRARTLGRVGAATTGEE
ncbi:hypothetical protein [Halomicrobium salinisoli]|uniref:hypothetical protein n=1 Tax=Halomicrobium salinisoli TaxID=2878391 RepID=UPI001CF07DD0|nr:hypothetical protein [Halomicrobium salinisoli]